MYTIYEYILISGKNSAKVDDKLRMKSSPVEITTVEQLRNRIMKVAKHKYERITESVLNTEEFINKTLRSFWR